MPVWVFAGAASYVETALCSAGWAVSERSGASTKSCAVLIGWATPNHFCRWMNQMFWPLEALLYGGP